MQSAEICRSKLPTMISTSVFTSTVWIALIRLLRALFPPAVSKPDWGSSVLALLSVVNFMLTINLSSLVKREDYMIAQIMTEEIISGLHSKPPIHQNIFPVSISAGWRYARNISTITLMYNCWWSDSKELFNYAYARHQQGRKVSAQPLTTRPPPPYHTWRFSSQSSLRYRLECKISLTRRGHVLWYN